MANNKQRERQVMDAVACPDCGAGIGELCRIRSEKAKKGPRRPILHSSRRRAWQAARKGYIMTIWKYPIQIIGGKQPILIPSPRTFLDVQMQDGKPVLWALVDPRSPKQEVNILVYGTGHTIPYAPINAAIQRGGSLDHLGTVQDDHGSVWHVFSLFEGI